MIQKRKEEIISSLSQLLYSDLIDIILSYDFMFDDKNKKIIKAHSVGISNIVKLSDDSIITIGGHKYRDVIYNEDISTKIWNLSTPDLINGQLSYSFHNPLRYISVLKNNTIAFYDNNHLIIIDPKIRKEIIRKNINHPRCENFNEIYELTNNKFIISYKTNSGIILLYIDLNREMDPIEIENGYVYNVNIYNLTDTEFIIVWHGGFASTLILYNIDLGLEKSKLLYTGNHLTKFTLLSNNTFLVIGINLFENLPSRYISIILENNNIIDILELSTNMIACVEVSDHGRQKLMIYDIINQKYKEYITASEIKIIGKLLDNTLVLSIFEKTGGLTGPPNINILDPIILSTKICIKNFDDRNFITIIDGSKIAYGSNNGNLIILG